jgi:uncharacterized protein YhbP (UPF0306 family)
MGMGTLKRSWNDKNALRSIYRILGENLLCSMSTVTKENKAHINIAYFAYAKKGRLEIFYLSYPDSMHSKNLLLNPSMGMAIYNSNQEWGARDRGMQLLGKCKEAKGAVRERAESFYSARYRKYAEWRKDFAKERGTFELRFYRFIPRVAMFLDEGEKEYGDSLVVVPVK